MYQNLIQLIQYNIVNFKIYGGIDMSKIFTLECKGEVIAMLKHNEIGYLCPACEDAYKNIMCDFMDNEHHEITINGGKKEFYNFKERAESE